jgi:hypothetical protein
MVRALSYIECKAIFIIFNTVITHVATIVYTTHVEYVVGKYWKWEKFINNQEKKNLVFFFVVQ